jgi:hypothetical protein
MPDQHEISNASAAIFLPRSDSFTPPGSRRGRDACGVIASLHLNASTAVDAKKWPRMHAISHAGQACISPSMRARWCAAITSRQWMHVGGVKRSLHMHLALDESQVVCSHHFMAADSKNGRRCM